MKKKAIFGWLAALAVLVGASLYSYGAGEPYLTEVDDNCTGDTYICGVVEG